MKYPSTKSLLAPSSRAPSPSSPLSSPHSSSGHLETSTPISTNPDMTADDFKPGSEPAHVEDNDMSKVASNDPLRNVDAEFGGTEERRRMERKLLRKLDARMSIMVVIYILNYIDRNNAAAAKLRGFETDLGLKGKEFATLLSILYVGYILMQVPSNMFLNYIGKPSLYLPACMLIWGAISCLTGITHNFVGALLTRFFLGFVEAAFFPGALFLLSKWYKREELGLRTAILYCGNLSSNAFGGLIAAGILDGMQGKLGHAAWRWLFFIEGAVTMAVAILAIFILPDFPSTTKWLSPMERRLAQDAGGEADHDTKEEGAFHGLILAVKDWKVWWLALALTAQVVGLSFNAYFPTLTATLGYNHRRALLARFVPLFVGIIGFVIAEATMNTAGRYIALFLMAQSYAGFIVFFSWCSNSLPRPPSKRAVALALINAFSQLGNVAGSYVWPNEWGTTYRNSYAICIACFGCAIAMCFAFRQHLITLNHRLDNGEEVEGMQERRDALEEAAELEGVTVEEVRQRRKGFRFAY
ncbi:major facilitator superfamily transporter [Rhizoctonia solani]|uniref:Major facilitator superfamily transporter n=1 Tax=Rhizoctonia solani TaxID=456999 RepID=A0A8H8SUK7_9AGAM|nr:major facilitator superfamily transporter [Rhizoctonia solani]QRW19031.1 major facilitator superfamily transporter [Rhizoctonia solani]